MDRATRFCRGDWLALLDEAHQVPQARGPAIPTSEQEATRQKRAKAVRKVQLAEVSHGRQALMQAALAPGNNNTLVQLTDEDQRPQQLSEPIPADLLEWVPPSPVNFDRRRFLSNARSAHRGVSGGL